MKLGNTVGCLLFLCISFSCRKPSKEQANSQRQQLEISTIDSLLRDERFALTIAQSQSETYYTGVGETPPPFLLPGEDTASVQIKKKDDRVATSIAGFYALECGLGAICAKTNQTPTNVLQSIVDNKADSASVLLLNRFANATWKAGQPFRALERIKRPIFMVASLLPADEVRKDYDQILAGAKKLLPAMQDVRNGSLDDQMKKLRSLLKDERFTVYMASSQEAAYHTAQQQKALDFLSPEAEKATLKKPVKDQKIATNIAGFYALECGLNYLVTVQDKLPSDILQSIVSDSISKDDKQLLCRFANATWKAGQPFRGLDRIGRRTFTPFYFLNEADIEKDWVQVKAAAGVVLKGLH